ncbi:ferritin [candidate division KSB1 bacterium]|nr:ferritin [candidate division KSB1 bacterium]
MLSQKMIDKINEQIKNELYSGHLYLSMAAYCSSQDLDGFANFFVVQEQEERYHAMKFYHYLVEQGADVKIYGLDQPKQDFKSVEEVFQLAYEHEQKVTGLINDLMELAVQDKDYATQSFLNWYIDEQVEEEASMQSILKKLQMVGVKGHGLLMLDSQLGARSFTPPSKEE